MGKSGQRVTYYKIIDRPELKLPIVRLAEGVVTGFFWAVWIYFITPILTIILWIMGFKFFHSALFSTDDMMELLQIIHNASVVVLGIFFLNIAWIWHNYRIYKKTGNRRRFAPVFPEDKLARLFDLDLAVLKKTKEKNRINVSLTGKKITVT
ncbi:MAG: poly-beta-1,6-N-acetyl-D-glucosamine biosynthesis protein PgaD [Candidatus Omnitrophica bacterium]|nr:poly-beta-1,6-N-acetyl-D-glucosamine biosynthesis protein PgaD [Candidatus Omnitrophota bacterium]MBU1933369.1 poly-beta-1,6-N-acetyl-D-glucosamine biosynthesis protein PgaD [Candidatus Omnitrophota bacterium]